MILITAAMVEIVNLELVDNVTHAATPAVAKKNTREVIEQTIHLEKRLLAR